MLHLSWSPVFLAMVMVVWTGFVIFAWKKKVLNIKQSIGYHIAGVALFCFLAIDVGEKTTNINKSQFNQPIPEQVLEKTESARIDAEATNQKYQETLKK